MSQTNSEQASDGYTLVNLYGSWQARENVVISAGVENLFDKHYQQHLAGYNRISGSDIVRGARLPGAGRGVFVKLSVRK